MDWVDGKHIDEIVSADNRNSAIKQMKDKYPNHDFAYVCELV
jgi:NifU-like protein involved in Fe-S cluster formation